MSGDPAIELTGFTKEYRDSEGNTITAADDVSFEVPEHSVVGLLGPNGAGKTTTLKSILGLVTPTAGTIRIQGRDASELGHDRFELISGMLEGARNIYWRLTLRENLRYFTSIQGIDPDQRRDEHRRLLYQLELDEKADEQVKKLSRGMQQKAKMACVLVRETPIVLLDEPTLGLDVQATNRLQERLKRMASEEDRTVILSSHDMDVIQNVCDHVIIMSNGKKLVDRQVSDLLHLFESDSYVVELDGQASRGLRNAVERHVTVERWDHSLGRTEFTIVVNDRAQLFQVVSELESDGVTPVSIERDQPDLEEAFLQLIDDSFEEVLEA
jgi:ABC-2 type transport system ATP-binding protein